MVISWKINRISRKLSDVLKIVDILEQNSTSFNSYSEQFDNSTPAGKLQFQMMALIGEFERGTIAQNVKEVIHTENDVPELIDYERLDKIVKSVYDFVSSYEFN